MRWPIKSRSLRRIKRKTPGAKTVVHLKQRKHSKPTCATCKKILISVNHSAKCKSDRRPTRPYAGKLCSACTRRLFIEKSRKGDKQ